MRFSAWCRFSWNCGLSTGSKRQERPLKTPERRHRRSDAWKRPCGQGVWGMTEFCRPYSVLLRNRMLDSMKRELENALLIIDFESWWTRFRAWIFSILIHRSSIKRYEKIWIYITKKFLDIRYIDGYRDVFTCEKFSHPATPSAMHINSFKWKMFRNFVSRISVLRECVQKQRNIRWNWKKPGKKNGILEL